MEDFTAEDKSELNVKLGDCVVVMAKDPSGTVVPVLLPHLNSKFEF